MENSQIIAMRKLGMTEEEIASILDADKRIDKGEKLFELSESQQKASKQARQVARAPTVYNFPKKERKSDETKRAILKTLIAAVMANYDVNPEIVNPEREFLFTVNEKKYKIVLSAPRK